jgi:hypothetical protein
MTWLAERDRAAVQPLPAACPNPLLDVRPLSWNEEGRLAGIGDPRRPDPCVFGDWNPPPPDQAPPPADTRTCREHGVRWSGDGGCWAPGHGRANGG